MPRLLKYYKSEISARDKLQGGRGRGLDIGGLPSHNLSCLTVRKGRGRMLGVGGTDRKDKEGRGYTPKVGFIGKEKSAQWTRPKLVLGREF